MKISKTKLAAASFGAALTSLYSVPELSAQINIDFIPDTVPYFMPGTQTSLSPVRLGGLTTFLTNIPEDLCFANDFYGVVVDGASSFGLINGDTTFNGGATTAFLTFPISSTGIQTIGFVIVGEIGYFRVDLGQPGDPITFIDGQLATSYGPLTIPPLPGGDDVVLGDVDGDGDVDFEDIPAFVGLLTGGGFQAEADIDMDGDVDFEDIPLFIGLLTDGSVNVQAGLPGLAMGATGLRARRMAATA